MLLGHAHVNTLAETMVLAEERVGELRRSKPEGATTGVLNTGTVSTGTVSGEPHIDVKRATVTWADVVNRPAVRKGQLAHTTANSKIVLQRSFSENNPVNRKV